MNPLSFLTSFCFASVAFAKNNPFHARKPRDVSEAFHILKSLPQDCYRYDNGVYTYEYCHMESARQISDMKSKNSRDEWDLGHFNPQTSIQKYNPKRRLVKVSLENGSPCPETHAPRRSKVLFSCVNPDLSMHIVHVREKTKCNYRIFVHVPELCPK